MWIHYLHAAKYELPLESIFYIGHLEKTEFDSIYPGNSLNNPESDLAEGFYIVYEHESLSYYFGPAKNKALLEGYKEVLDDVVRQVKEKRPSLVTGKTFYYPSEINQKEESSASSVFKTPQTMPPIKPWWETVFDILGW